MATTDQKEELSSNITFNCDVWSMTAKDGAVKAYTNLSQKIVVDSVAHYPSFGEITRPVRNIGFEPDTFEFIAAYDSVVTRADVEGGRWKGAVIIRKTLVNYFDLSLGSVAIMKGKAGSIRKISETMFRVEFVSLKDAFSQTIGDLTSSVDRRRRLDDLGINIASFTHAGTVTAVTDRRKFKIDYVQPSPNYFRYGLVDWLTGANATTQGMEIKSSTTTDGGTRTEIELQKPMRSVVAIGDTASFFRGYDGTRAAAKALGAEVMESFDGEPDIPPLSWVLRYPEVV